MKIFPFAFVALIGSLGCVAGLGCGPDVPMLTKTAVNFSNAGRPDLALPYAKRAAEAAPNDAEAQKAYGLALCDTGSYEQAMGPLDTAIKLKPDFAKAFNVRGKARYGMHQYKAAIADYRKAVELSPDYAKAWYNLSLAYKADGKSKESDEAYQKSKDLRSNSSTGQL